MHLSMLHLLRMRTGSVEQRRLGNLLAENVALEEVWEPHLGLVLEVDGRGDREDLVQFLEGELLGFAHEAENHAPCNEIESGVETDYKELVFHSCMEY
jgi:hypothetical protein